MLNGRDRRRYPRFRQNDIVRLTLLSEDGRSEDACIVDASVSGVRINTSLQIAAGSLVKIEWKDTLLLGEVLYAQTTDSVNTIGVELTRALYGMSELRRLNANLTNAAQALRQESATEPAAAAPLPALR